MGGLTQASTSIAVVTAKRKVTTIPLSPRDSHRTSDGTASTKKMKERKLSSNHSSITTAANKAVEPDEVPGSKILMNDNEPGIEKARAQASSPAIQDEQVAQFSGTQVPDRVVSGEQSVRPKSRVGPPWARSENIC